MRRIWMSIGSFVGAIAGIVIIKQLDLPGVVTFILVAALVLGVIYLMASLMGDGKKAAPADTHASPDKT